MICPECQAEYRDGFTVCADCDVALVAALPAKKPQTEVLGEGDFVVIWKGDIDTNCVAHCVQLRDAGILYHVAQTLSSSYGMRTDWRYELSVRKDTVDAARELLGFPDGAVMDESSSAPIEENEDEALPAAPEDGNAMTDAARIRNAFDSYLNPWYPEDACIEVWKQSNEHGFSSVGVCLRANCIRVREEEQEDGSKKYFVMPEDETVAREIVRQIVEGKPPQ
jgi:hypothetical protein